MKTLLFIICTTAAFVLSQYKNMSPPAKKINNQFNSAYMDSILEAGRVDRMKYKMQ